MERRVFIIKGLSKSPQELDLDRHFCQNYIDYFTSVAGGAYEAGEIEYIEEPQAAKLNDSFQCCNWGYCIVVLIGHGATQKDKQIFQLNNAEIIRPGQITTSAPKNLIILESCRTEVTNILTVDLNDKIPKFKYGGIVRAPITREKSKELYFDQLNTCGNGTVVCFACSNNETAKNFYFSLVLLQIGFDWHLEHWHHFETLTITRVMPHISTEVNRLSLIQTGEDQTPQINGNLDFPFSVSKF